ncbi:MAG: tripartite tricarboxylate transporter substrate binding protein, partial [Burkholderiaceae bacterium]
AAATNQAIAASVYSNQAANLITDFVPIAGVGIAPHALVVPVTLPVKSAAELIAYIKADPGKYNFASQGTGTLSHLEAELFVKENGLSITHVPYKGSSQALPDVVNGSSIMMFDSIAGSSSLVQAGKLKFLAVASSSRTTTLPNVPTLAEAGVKNVAADNLFGMLAPKGTPQPIIDRLSKALEHVLADPGLRAKLAVQGVELRFMPAPEFGKTIVEEHRYWGGVVRAAKVNIN